MNYIVSFPRSGQHLIESIIKYLCDDHNINYSYCEFYNCCQSIPCINESLFNKNHDFWIDPINKEYDFNHLKIDNNSKYLVLYRRDLILQLESYYRFHIMVENKDYKFEDLINFIKDNDLYYKNFIKKWVDIKDDRVIKVEYYDFIKEPDDYTIYIFNHFFPDVKFNSLLDYNNIKLNIFNGYKSYDNSILGIKNNMDVDTYNLVKKSINVQ